VSELLTSRPVSLNVLTGARAALGMAAVFMPNISARMFRLNAEGTPAIMMVRIFGIRNAVLAAVLLRLDTITVPRTFMRLNVLIDLVDAFAFVAAGRRREIGPAAAVLGTWVALSAVGLGATGLVAMRTRLKNDA
jgi:hypothetical protein